MAYSLFLQTQNQIRSLLEELPTYQADKHFKSLSNNTPRIHESNIYTLIPFKNQNGGFKPFDYMTDAIGFLNKKGNDCCSAEQHLRAGLTYDGFINLITVKRGNKDGKQIKASIAHKIAFDTFISQRLAVCAQENDVFRKADNIVGILILLECLKQNQKYGPSRMTCQQQQQISKVLNSTLLKNNGKMQNNYLSNTPNSKSQIKLSRMERQQSLQSLQISRAPSIGIKKQIKGTGYNYLLNRKDFYEENRISDSRFRGSGPKLNTLQRTYSNRRLLGNFPSARIF